MYYRLFDRENRDYLHTGYNCTTQEEVRQDLISLYEPDLIEIYETESPELQLMLDVNSLILEVNKTKFEDNEI